MNILDKIVLEKTIKDLGIYEVEIKLHPEVGKKINLNVARTEEEALIQEKTGKAVVESVEENNDNSIDPKTLDEISIENLDVDKALNEISSDNDPNDKSPKN